MKHLVGVLFGFLMVLASGPSVFAGDCTYKPYVRDGHVRGTMVLNEFNTYCGYAVKTHNGIRLYIDNEGRYEPFTNAYAFDDVLRYLCSKCAYEVTEPEKAEN